ncbi:ABC transporter substrate-binding protein [Salinarimonas ramus]|uniref:ABC transporter substrate-binding protein n=1 Tax=Salinarimonas ramus TaxID=690164 RepID=A0A917Q622_9HYPH|nr:ABC transporter substrate-binding protein [Salinarimonas ramus]GGK28921.1 ABC transporter substrate-binding protein [Salinarimonas ramus]
MTRFTRTFAAATLGLLATTALTHAQSTDPMKVGVIVTLSGPAASLGEQARDGFQLAIDQLGGELGGVPVEVVVADDEQKPDVALTRVNGLIEREDVDVVVGPIFSNILQAIHKPVMDADRILISPNAGPSSYAGAECNPNFFVTSYQNDQVHEVMGRVAQDRGYERVFILVPNYQAGRDSAAGFKRHFEGEIVDEVYTQLGQLDFSAELARIAAMQPDALFTFMPGGMGVNLVRQYNQAGLKDRIPFLSAFTVDESTLPAQQDAAMGMFGAMTWAPDMDTPGNAEFVAAYIEKYGKVPGSYAMQAYDTAMLLDAAVEAAGGADDQEALLEAIRTADFQSLRGDFAFNNNQYPIQDFYLVDIGQREDGMYQTQIVEQVFDDYGDVYASECQMGG